MRNLIAGLVVAAALLAPSPSLASPAFEAMLSQAEAVRSADPAQFNRLIGELNATIGGASPRQRELLEYLKAYQLIYSGRLDLGTAAAEELFRSSTDPAIRYRVGALLVFPYASRRDFSEALRYMNESMLLEDQIDDPAVLAHGWAAAGGLLNQLGRYEDGLRYAKLLRDRSPEPRTRCFGETMAIESQYHFEPAKLSFEAIDAVIGRCLDIGEPLVANFARTFRAQLMADRGERNEAAIFLNQHLESIESTRYPRLIAEANAVLAQLNLETGDFDAAERHARRIIGMGAAVDVSPPIVAAHRVLYESALQRGNTVAALAHHINYAEADKAYLNEVKARAMAFQEVAAETREKDQAIELLGRQNEVLQLQQQVDAQQQRNTLLLVLLLAGLLGTIAFWAWRTKKAQLLFRRLAETDALTGISNRMHFSRRAEEALEYCRKDGEDAGLVMFDLDEFKAINDRFGHAVGDWVLKQVADTCSAICRKHDRFGRLGGEEFAFLLVGCDLGSAIALAQECRKRIAAIDTAPSGHVFRITASFGVAGTRNCGYDFLTLLSRADDALYRSKREGRDRVHVHGLEAAPADLHAG
ncbi:GGDEF domain-containing protein [bacterium BD-1]|nr:GGDEF domain-containing protein [Ottowia caeni]